MYDKLNTSTDLYRIESRKAAEVFLFVLNPSQRQQLNHQQFDPVKPGKLS